MELFAVRTTRASLAIFVYLIMLLSNGLSEATLSTTFYAKTCPRALTTIQTAVRTAVSHERRMAASLIRLHFHDCFVKGCDASLLLDESSSFSSEKNAIQNLNSARGFEVIDDIKSRIENICPGVVSCADILAVAARDATVAVGGQTWKVKLGRRDSKTASKSKAEKELPSVFASLRELISIFKKKGLSAKDMVALSGSHTIGQAQCLAFRSRIYNGTNIDAGFAKTRSRGCPSVGGNSNLAPLDLVTPNSFDTNYFKNLIRKKGLLDSDQVLFSGGSTDGLVTYYSNNRDAFFSDFASAMVKMGDIDPLTGSSGQIRRNCRLPN